MKKLRLTWVPLLILGVVAVFVVLVESDSATVFDSGDALTRDKGATNKPAISRNGEEKTDGFQEIITFWARIGEVEFPHLMHSEELGMECVECHHETNAAALDMPHEEYFDDFWIDCGTCHRSNSDIEMVPQACSYCHHTDPTGVADESLSSKVVTHTLCWDCHGSGTGTEASESCVSCHFGDRTSFIEPLPDS